MAPLTDIEGIKARGCELVARHVAKAIDFDLVTLPIIVVVALCASISVERPCASSSRSFMLEA